MTISHNISRSSSAVYSIGNNDRPW